MISDRILVTGGAGFIGSRLVGSLIEKGYQVLILDNLHQQVHGVSPNLQLTAPLVKADVRDRSAIDKVLVEFKPSIVIHLAAETGTGQSADLPARYADVNIMGTAHLIEAMRATPFPPRRVILAATRAVYGEGAYLNETGSLIVPAPRRDTDMAVGRFDPLDSNGTSLRAIPTPETAPVCPGSVYGSTKLMQEYLIQQTPSPWDYVILRLQNVYGPGQSLLNPYTGVLCIFCQQAMEGITLNIYEDGEIVRDFVFVDDVVRAFIYSCEIDKAGGKTINIGTGKPSTIVMTARMILSQLGLPDDRFKISGAYRSGDIRHAVSDITLASSVLRWLPEVSLSEGVAALVNWVKSENLP
jgi:dTDP-L-rhamnose 4-epimerase